MTTEVSICNQALGWLGEGFITSLDDDSKAAELCKLNYPELRNAVLEAANWTFASKRFELPKTDPPPPYGYANRYRLPSEVLRVIEVNKIDYYDPTRDWQKEGDSIVTNDNECRTRCIVQITDPTLFSPLFVQALAQRLAADLAVPITQSRALQGDHWQLYTAKMREAKALDGMQGKSKRARSRYLENARWSSGPAGAGPTV